MHPYLEPRLIVMSKKSKKDLNSQNGNLDRGNIRNEDLNGEADITDLSFNEEANSYEYDVNVEDGEYDHPDPYKTAAVNGADSNSDYDEANKEAQDQYKDNPDSIEDEYGMHIDSGKIMKVSTEDEELAKTPEDERSDLDEEGYPKNNLNKNTGEIFK